MLNTIPRELAMPKRVLINNKKDFLKLINKNNCKNHVYTTIYHFTDINNNKIDYNTAIIDKVFFDLDSDECYEDMLKLHREFNSNKLKHAVIFSGRGFHIYLFVKISNLKNQKDALTLTHKYFIDKLQLNVDEHIIGDLARLTRVINTYNIRRRRYCIPITEKYINRGYEKIRERAERQYFAKKYIFNKNLFDITQFDRQIIPTPLNIDINNIKSDIVDFNKLKIPPCVLMMLQNSHPIWKERGYVLTFFRDKGLTEEETVQIISKFWNKETIKHSIVDRRGDRQSYYIFKDVNRYLFPKCDKLMYQNLCPKKCNQYPHAIYLK